MASHAAPSASPPAAAHAAEARSAGGRGRTRTAIRAVAQPRLIAVGRVAQSVAAARATPWSDGSAPRPNAMPYAAVTPMSGAPRTCMVRIAVAACSSVARRTSAKRPGSAVWSMTITARPSPASWIARWATPPTFIRRKSLPFERHEGEDRPAGVLETLSPAQIGKVDRKARLHQAAAHLLDQPDRGKGGAPGGDEVIHQQHAGSRCDAARVRLSPG